MDVIEKFEVELGKERNKLRKAELCNNLGLLYSKMRNFPIALEYHKKELKYCYSENSYKITAYRLKKLNY